MLLYFFKYKFLNLSSQKIFADKYSWVQPDWTGPPEKLKSPHFEHKSGRFQSGCTELYESTTVSCRLAWEYCTTFSNIVIVNYYLHVWVRSCEIYGGRGLESDKMLCLFIDIRYLESIYLFNYLLIYLTIYVLIDVRYLESLRQNHSFRNMETVNKDEDRVGHLVTDPDYLKQRWISTYLYLSIYPILSDSYLSSWTVLIVPNFPHRRWHTGTPSFPSLSVSVFQLNGDVAPIVAATQPPDLTRRPLYHL